MVNCDLDLGRSNPKSMNLCLHKSTYTPSSYLIPHSSLSYSLKTVFFFLAIVTLTLAGVTSNTIATSVFTCSTYTPNFFYNSFLTKTIIQKLFFYCCQMRPGVTQLQFQTLSMYCLPILISHSYLKLSFRNQILPTQRHIPF